MPQWDHPWSAPYSPYECERSYDQAPALQKCKLRAALESPDHIRLLKLLPDRRPKRRSKNGINQPDANIECEVFQVSLKSLETDGQPYFATLSYVWGNSSTPVAVRCNRMRIYVTQSLYEALDHIRHPTLPRLVWVDSLCINQSNHIEKSEQVRRMHRIYGQSHCISWLGVETKKHNLKAMLPILTWFSNAEEKLRDQNLASNLNQVRRLYQEAAIAEMPRFDDIPWALLTRCLDWEYFRRVWCVQEIVLARSNDIRTSRTHLSISCLVQACRLMSVVTQKLPLEKLLTGDPKAPATSPRKLIELLSKLEQLFDARHLPCIKPLKTAQSETIALPWTLLIFSGQSCTNPRDHVYGLAALCDLREPFRIDYTLAVHEVFIDITLHCLQTTRSLTLLKLFPRGLRRTDKAPPFLNRREPTPGTLPSWCPDFAGPTTDMRELLPEAMYRRAPLRSCAGRPARFTQLTRQRLGVMGILVAKVQKCGATLFVSKSGDSSKEVSQGYARERRASWQSCLTSLGNRKTTRQLFKIYCDVCFAGKDPYHTNAWAHVKGSFPSTSRDRMIRSILGPAWLATESEYLSRRLAEDGLTINSSFSHQTRGFIADNLHQNFMMCSFGTRLFTTDNSAAILGTGPDRMHVGDAVVVLFGCDVPFILREVGNEGHWRVIGECYVHGIMHGEALDMGLEREFLLI